MRCVSARGNICELPTMAKRKRKATLTDQLRRAIDQSGQSRYAICKALDIDQGQLSKFMHGQRGLGLDVLDRLCAHLDLEIRNRQG